MEGDGEHHLKKASVTKSRKLLEKGVDTLLDTPWLFEKRFEYASLLHECETPEQEELVYELIQRLLFVGQKEFKLFLAETHALIADKWKLSAKNTLITTLSKDDNPTSGDILIQGIKHHFANDTGWSEENFISKLHVAANTKKPIDNFLILDDFVGTGKTISRQINYLRAKKQNAKIYVCAIAVMEVAVSIVVSSATEAYIANTLKKGINDHYTGEDLKRAIASMSDLESRLSRTYKSKLLSDFSFGYKKSETLYNFLDTNIPNNVFPIFWWLQYKDGSIRAPLFKRL